MIANSALPNKHDVFGASVSDFDPWSDDDFGTSGADAFADFAASHAGDSGFFKDDFTASTSSLGFSEENPLDESESIVVEKESSLSNHNSVSPDLTSPSRSSRSDRSKPSSSRRRMSSRSSKGSIDLTADAAAVSEDFDDFERTAPERKNSTSSHSNRRRLPPREDSRGGEDDLTPSRSRQPPMRRRSSSRRVMLESMTAPPRRTPRTDLDPAPVESEFGDDPADDVEAENKDMDGAVRSGPRGTQTTKRNSFRISKRDSAEKESDKNTVVSPPPAAKETLHQGRPATPVSALNTRRAAMTSAGGHRQLSSRRVSVVAEGKTTVRQNSLRQLFGGVEAKDPDVDASTVADDGSATIISRSVLQRSSSRRGNLTKSASVSLERPPSSGDIAHRTVTRNSSMNRKLENSRIGEQTNLENPPKGLSGDRRGSLQRSNSGLVRRPSSVRSNLTSSHDETGEQGDAPSSSCAAPSPVDASPRIPRHLPPSRSTSINGPLSQRRLQARASKDVST
jgi:hypothetical protein